MKFKIAYIDLGKKTTEIKDIPQELIKKFLGARGINSYLLYQSLNERVGAFDKENILIIGTGLLTGLPGLAFARTTVTGKSPETGLLGDANIGGHIGWQLRKAGITHLIICGISLSPVYILIEDERVSIEDALDIWGKDVFFTQEYLKQRHSSEHEILCIGQAGENQVRFAAVMNRKKNAAARCGMGCLMGSKKLKAIVVKGTGEIKPNDAERFNAILRQINRKLNEEFLIQRLRDFGTAHLYEVINTNIGMGRTYNGRTTVFLKNKDISPRNLKEKYYKGKAGCRPCVITCQHKYESETGIKNEGPEYGTIAHFGPMLGIDNLESILKINNLINYYGLDVSSTSNILGWIIELYQEGIIDKKFTAGLELRWGDADLVMDLIEKIAQRQGFGDFLANGAKEMSEKLPDEAKYYISWVKYLPQSDPVDLRYLVAFALGDSVASRGADHLRSRPIWEAFGLEEIDLEKIYGERISNDPFSYAGKARVIWWWEVYCALFDALGLCKLLAFHTMPGVFDFKVFADLINAAEGLNLSDKDVFKIGERILNIERMFLVREGISRGDDLPPVRLFDNLLDQEGLREEDKSLRLNRESFEKMLDEYYALRGWDNQGRPKPETLKDLGLI